MSNENFPCKALKVKGQFETVCAAQSALKSTDPSAVTFHMFHPLGACSLLCKIVIIMVSLDYCENYISS